MSSANKLLEAPRAADSPEGREPEPSRRREDVLARWAGGAIHSLRPHQWVKNSLVFAALVFSGQVTNTEIVLTALTAFALFCAASSGVYLLNDMLDRNVDRLHPWKRRRPIASGQFPVTLAVPLCLLLTTVALVGGFLVGIAFGGLLAVYVVQNVAYTTFLKRVAILDIMVIANGFVVRAVAGAVAVSVTASPWLVICAMMLALFVACGKRRHEIVLLQNHAADHRSNLTDYTPQLLDQMMAVTGCAGVMTYVLYSLSDWAIARYGSYALALTVPMVVYGVFRFLYLVHRRGYGGEPSRLFVADKGLLINGLIWLAVTCFAVYAPPELLPWWRIEL